jgi:hypothetical protein
VQPRRKTRSRGLPVRRSAAGFPGRVRGDANAHVTIPVVREGHISSTTEVGGINQPRAVRRQLGEEGVSIGIPESRLQGVNSTGNASRDDLSGAASVCVVLVTYGRPKPLQHFEMTARVRWISSQGTNDLFW